MWKKLVSLSEDNQQVIAKLTPDVNLEGRFDSEGVEDALEALNASNFYLLQDEIVRFVNCAKEGKGEAQVGFAIAEKRDASVEVDLSEQDMLASMIVTGAYGGKALRGPQIVQALAQAHITKGINKAALKKILVMSHQLKPGETFTQPVAKGKEPIQGQDAKFIPLVQDITKQVLAPTENDDGKVDMLNLGETVTVDEKARLMKRIPATKGTSGLTVQGTSIPPQSGNDAMLKASKGSEISPDDPNLLIASVSGMPMIKERTVEVEDALCLPTIGVATGHIKFKGNVLVTGDIESDMVVRVTGNLTVGGFIESADVQAQGNIDVAKGIIGHNVSGDEKKSCQVKSGGTITANYAQFSEIQAGDNIHLSVHCMNNELRCGQDLTVSDAAEKQGTLSGGSAKVGGKVVCINLGVEGDTATHVHAFAKYHMFKERQKKYKEEYRIAQEATMEGVRQELEFKKKPKAERSEEEEASIESHKKELNQHLEKVKMARDSYEMEFEQALVDNIIEVKNKVYTHVTAQFGEEKVTTKRVHGASTFSFNQFEIRLASMLDEEALESE
ncbi:DUF342 domain-containing protein [Vibrio ostreicida]|uniref:FapA family protein n=1 Tax=Vibrio ostreicida TaxID=526588 RepID=A0ABT8BZP9_9VIBR|nr:FapA family protein [Vibrio ostreicida]MDN3612163.1 FapA family protein [Vibrio ostreicida]NPD08560.1 DUF342 domain-containing protein [Vibrio ostreicida]